MESVVNGWAYSALLGTLFLTGVGLPPLPEEIPIVAAGIAANRGELDWRLAWPACVLGVLSADILLYGLGRVCGPALMQRRWVQRVVSPARREQLEGGFRQHGLKILLGGRLLPGMRTGVFLTAGTMRYPFLQFLIVDGPAAVVSVGVVFFAGFILTDTVARCLDDVGLVRDRIAMLVMLCMIPCAVYKLRARH